MAGLIIAKRERNNFFDNGANKNPEKKLNIKCKIFKMKLQNNNVKNKVNSITI